MTPEETPAPPKERRPSAITEEQARDLIHREMSEVLDEIRSIRRAVVGAPLEGNRGMLQRMETTERRVAWLLWSIPIWVTTGTAAGQWLTAWITGL